MISSPTTPRSCRSHRSKSGQHCIRACCSRLGLSSYIPRSSCIQPLRTSNEQKYTTPTIPRFAGQKQNPTGIRPKVPFLSFRRSTRYLPTGRSRSHCTQKLRSSGSSLPHLQRHCSGWPTKNINGLIVSSFPELITRPIAWPTVIYTDHSIHPISCRHRSPSTVFNDAAQAKRRRRLRPTTEARQFRYAQLTRTKRPFKTSARRRTKKTGSGTASQIPSQS